MLAQARVRTITVHTRKESIAIFEELKNKINATYQSQSPQSLRALLAVIRTLFYLAPLPKLLIEINTIGTLPVTGFLENLLIKSRMIKFSFRTEFQGWIVALLSKFDEFLPQLNIRQLKILKEIPFSPQAYQWHPQQIVLFIQNSLQQSTSDNDFGLFGSIVILLRNFIVHCDEKFRDVLSTLDWREVVIHLTKGCWILNDIVREETAICINYYLCLKQPFLCQTALENGVVSYLLQMLSSKFTFESFSKKIIEFLTFLLFHGEPSTLKGISIESFEEILSKFITRSSKSTVLSEARNLMSLLDKKFNLNHELKLQKLSNMLESQSRKQEPQIIKILSIILLYAQNENMNQLLIKSHHKFEKYLVTSSNEIIIKMILELLSLCFTSGRVDISTGQAMVSKIDSLISDESLREKLNADKKRMLTDLVKIIKALLSNREFNDQISHMISHLGIESKLWLFSDCTNYEFQKEMIDLSKQLGSHHQGTEMNIFQKLQEDFIKKSRTNFGKATLETYDQIKLLDELLAKSEHKSSELSISQQLPEMVCNYIHVENDQAPKLLNSLEKEEKEQLRKKLNLICCKILLKLAKFKNETPLEMAKFMQLASSQDQFDEVYTTISPYLKYHNHHKPVKADQVNKNPHNLYGNQSKEEHQSKIKGLVKEYFSDQTANSSFVLGLLEQDFEIVITEIQAYESEENLLKSVKLLLEMSKIQIHCLQIFLKFSMNLIIIYNYLLSNPSDSNKQSLTLLDSLFVVFIRLHIDLYYNDHFLDVSFCIQILTALDLHFEAHFSKKRILLLELIFEYFDMNKMFNEDNVVLMMNKYSRQDMLKSQVSHSKGQVLGFCLGSLLHGFDHLERESLALQLKKYINELLTEANVNVAKFASLFYRECSQETFRDYHLEDWAEAAVKIIEQQLAKMDIIVSQSSQAARKLRVINYFLEVITTLNKLNGFAVKKSLLFAQEDVLIDSLKNILYYIEVFQTEQFKKHYLEELAAKTMTGLVNLYRQNFRLLKVRGGETIQHFQYLLSINNEGVNVAVCEMMRILLLKKQVKMIDCQTYNACKMYRESLPPLSQQHLYYCQMIEHILYEDGDIEEQFNCYFDYTANNQEAISNINQNAQIATVSAYLISEQELPKEDNLLKKQSSQFSEPLFLEFQPQPSIREQCEKNINSEEESIIAKLSSEIEVKEARQDQFDGSTKIIQQLEAVWTEQELLDQIQQYLQHPESVPIQNISNNLVSIPSKKYYNLLIQLFLRSRVEEKMLPPKLTSREIQQKIIQHIPVQFCELDDSFYEVLNSGIEGAKLGLKYPNVGLKGLQIYSKKFMNSLKQQQISTYAQLLSQKKTFQELKYLKNCKIYEVVNDKLPYFIKNNQSLTQLCNFISQTCKYPPLCNCYQVTNNLCTHVAGSALEPQIRAQILSTIKNLAKNSEKHKKKMQNVQFLSELIEMLPRFEKQELSNVAELLLMGSDDNIEIGQLYQQLSLEEIIINILESLLKSDAYHYETFLNLLRVLEGLASLPQSAARILKRGFMQLCQPISSNSIKACNFDLIGSTIDILRSLLEQMELSLSRVVSELQKEGFFQYLLFVGKYLAKSRQIESYLGIYCKLLPNPTISKKFLDNLDKVLSIMNELARDQLSTQALLQQWMRVLFLLLESNRYSFVSQILKSNIFFSSANCIRSFQTLNEKLLSLNSRMMREIVTKSEVKAMLALHGYADFLVQLMRMQNLPIDEYLKILNTLSELYKNRHFTGKLCTELFAVVITKLQLSWKEDISISSIVLLKTIKRKVEVTAEFSTNMLDFFGKFLTQSSKVSSFEYYAISRELICLLSHFMIFNEQIRYLFRTDLVIDILKNWVRIAKALDYNEMAQTFKLFYYSTYAGHNLYIDLCEVNSKSIANAQLVFERGWRCNLFRVNGSFKEAFLKVDKSKQEIIAYKFPDGVVKDKYRIHFKDLLIIQNYQSEKNILFMESCYTRTLNIFQHKPLPTNCLTFIGLSENNYEVREISIEVINKQDLSQIQSNATILASKWNEGQIEEQSKTWQMLNKK